MTFSDDEFGEVVVRRNALSTSIRFSFMPDGRLRISIPKFLSDRRAMSAMETSREAIRELPRVIKTTADIDTLRKKARHYLPRRLMILAKKHGFEYKMGKLTHSSTRWGSCNSSGSINLNISLMRLPVELIDYVIIHELCHTRHMNHSKLFWEEVGKCDPKYKGHRKILRESSPTA